LLYEAFGQTLLFQRHSQALDIVAGFYADVRTCLIPDGHFMSIPPVPAGLALLCPQVWPTGARRFGPPVPAGLALLCPQVWPTGARRFGPPVPAGLALLCPQVWLNTQAGETITSDAEFCAYILAEADSPLSPAALLVFRAISGWRTLIQWTIYKTAASASQLPSPPCHEGHTLAPKTQRCPRLIAF